MLALPKVAYKPPDLQYVQKNPTTNTYTLNQTITGIANIIKDDKGSYGICHSFFLRWLVWFLFVYSLGLLKCDLCRSFSKDIQYFVLLIFTVESHALDSGLLMLSISFWKKVQICLWSRAYVLLYLLYQWSFLMNSESIVCSNSSKSTALKCQHVHKEQNQEWILKKTNSVTIHI